MNMRKKQIIKQINEMVQIFNENNKAVREANKVPKTEHEVSELIARNKSIQNDATNIDAEIVRAKDFADQIDKRLDALSETLIERLREKYTNKNALIDECDDLFEKA